jgi:ElaB/YqjD/DUF883 family membrane-anchored ribosome-binding protein
MSLSSLIERDSRREMLLDEVERSRQALNKTVGELKTNLQPAHLANEAARPIINQTNVAIESAKNFVRANPLISLSATTAGVMALTASARSYRKANQHLYNNNGYVPSPRVKRSGIINYLGRMSSNVLDRVSDTSTNLVQEAANVVKHHIDHRTSTAENAAMGVVRNLTQTAVVAVESILLSTISNRLRARKYSTRNENRSMDDDPF